MSGALSEPGAARFADLDGASALITGGASGIGAALTQAFAAQGARVAFLDLLDGAALADAVAAEGAPRPLPLRCDATDVEALRAAARRAAEAHGPVSVLVNCVANDERHAAETVEPAFWDRMMAVNLRAYFFAAQAVAPGMRAAGRGAIVNYSSISYMMGMAGMAAYTTANAGVTALTRTLAREFGPDGVRVNAVAPGWVLTERQLEKWVTPESLAAYTERACLKTPLKPADMVAPTLFLASKASGAITGQTIAVDGGVVTVSA